MVEDNNLFMMCRQVREEAFSNLPEGFYFDQCKESELEIWKAFLLTVKNRHKRICLS